MSLSQTSQVKIGFKKSTQSNLDVLISLWSATYSLISFLLDNVFHLSLAYINCCAGKIPQNHTKNLFYFGKILWYNLSLPFFQHLTG